MEESLEDFLKKRAIPADVINELFNQKIDADAINLMNLDQLETFFPCLGDRFAIKEFAKIQVSRAKGKDSLIEKLRKKFNKKGQKKNYTNDNSSDEERMSKRRPHIKETRHIEIGWLCSEDGNRHIQVRTKQGGGTRKISMSRDAKKDDIIERAKELFFPQGISTKGPLSNFSVDLWDYKHYPLIHNITINDMFDISGFSRLRFYLATTKKTSTVTSELANVTQLDTTAKFEYQPEDTVVAEYLLLDEDASGVNYFETVNEDVLNTEPESYENFVADAPVSQDIVRLTIHRGQAMDELITAFSFLDEKCGPLQIEMIFPNGKQESGHDFGGVFRDALSEFWSTFYESCTNGTDCKIPFLRHDFTEKWMSIARILYKGYKNERYFPYKLCPSFVEYCIFGEVKISNLEEDYLRTLGENEREVLKLALRDFNKVHYDDLLDILDTMQCKVTVITATNIKHVVETIAHKEIIQEPKFIIDCWGTVLKNMISIEEFKSIYSNSKPTGKSIISRLHMVDDENDRCSAKTFEFLKKYLREASEDRLQRFLRFCTGADILTENFIKVSFTCSTGYQRTPVGHTCGCVLELPTSYDNFPEFRTELNNVLDSNIWIMDLI